MWLINSSIGRKVVMSVTGIALILFLTFHGCMNVVALFSGKAYDMICGALGANWYAVVATLGLAALAVCHIVYAFILTAQNRRARGNQRYEVTAKPETGRVGKSEHVGTRYHHRSRSFASPFQLLVQHDVCRTLGYKLRWSRTSRWFRFHSGHLR